MDLHQKQMLQFNLLKTGQSGKMEKNMGKMTAYRLAKAKKERLIKNENA